MRGIAALSLGLLSLACACAFRGQPPAGDATAAARRYVLEHRPELEREIKLGSGEALYQLSIIADCRDLPGLGRTLNRKQAEIFPTPAATDPEVADRILVLLRERTELVCRDLELGPTRPFTAGRHQVYSLEEDLPGGPPLLSAGLLSERRRGEPSYR
jgi:hypothetical protein